jgi:hypothetical protein
MWENKVLEDTKISAEKEKEKEKGKRKRKIWVDLIIRDHFFLVEFYLEKTWMAMVMIKLLFPSTTKKIRMSLS